MPPRTVNASHWYDLPTLGGKTFNPRELRGALDIAVAEKAVADRFTSQLAIIAKAADALGPEGAPTLIGEFGIPFDLDHGAAYTAWAGGDRSAAPWAKHVQAQSLMYDAMDRLFLSSTQWNYTASNRNDASAGDNRNQGKIFRSSRATRPRAITTSIPAGARSTASRGPMRGASRASRNGCRSTGARKFSGWCSTPIHPSRP